jgi:hypothetical protein
VSQPVFFAHFLQEYRHAFQQPCNRRYRNWRIGSEKNLAEDDYLITRNDVQPAFALLPIALALACKAGGTGSYSTVRKFAEGDLCRQQNDHHLRHHGKRFEEDR